MTEAEGAGLGHLGDSEVHTMLPGRRGPETTAGLRELAATPVQLEQYIDLVTGRTFRQSILMKPAAMMHAQRNLDPARLAGLHASAKFVGLPEAGASGPFVFTDGFGRTLTTGSARSPAR